MLIGHYAVGFGGRAAVHPTRSAPSLGTWFLAVQWLDLIWPALVLAGVERVRISPSTNPFLCVEFTSYPWTHSLLAALVWAALFAGAYRWRTGNGRSALWLGGGVLSHWVLDLIVHVPDMTLYPGGNTKFGFGLWRSVTGTLILEGAMFVLAVSWYARTTRANDAVGRWAFWSLAALLALIYVANVMGPPPTNDMAIGVGALLLWLFVPWAYWADRHRVPRGDDRRTPSAFG